MPDRVWKFRLHFAAVWLFTANTLGLHLDGWWPSVLICLCCTGLLLLTTGFHLEALNACDRVLLRPRAPPGRVRSMALLLAIATAHVLEVLAYAAAYWLLGRHGGAGTLGGTGEPAFSAALYFSLETFSSLGYGDLLPTGALRLMAGAEAVNGLLLIGWSACHVHAVLNRATRPRERRRSRRRAR